MQYCLDSVQQQGEVAKERHSKNVLDNSSHASSDYKIDSNTLIFPVCFYVIHNMSKRSIKDFFNVIQDESIGSNDEEGKRSTVLPGRAVKPLLRNIVYDDFTENSQAVAAPPQDIFPEESSTSQFRQNGPLYPEEACLRKKYSSHCRSSRGSVSAHIARWCT